MSLTIYTRHPIAPRIEVDVEEATVEADPTFGHVTVTDKKDGAILAKVSGADFALMVDPKRAKVVTP